MNEFGDIFSTVAETTPQRIWDGVTGRARYGNELTLASRPAATSPNTAT
jgi:hypothetical protein